MWWKWYQETQKILVLLFRNLKNIWNSLKINMEQLKTFNQHNSEESLQRRALEVLAWASQFICKKWPRDDYKELIQLIIVWFGGYVRNFTFKMPGADHHARWMSKAIYFMKLALLEKQYQMTDVQILQVRKMA